MEQQYTPSGRGPELAAVFGSFMILSTLTISLRVYVRTSMVKIIGLDDWAAAVGWLLFNIQGGFTIAGVFHGTGQHANLIPASDLPIALMWYWLCEPLYFVSNMAVKLSISLMLLRFVVEQSHKIIILTMTGILQLCSALFLFLFIFQCTPSSFFWTRAQGETDGACINPTILVYAVYIYTAINCVTDGIMALLPWLMVRKLQLDRRTKLMIAVVLGLGSIASIATIVRVPYIRGLTDTKDFLYSSTDIAIWATCETGLSLVASSMATLKPLFNPLFERGRLHRPRSELEEIKSSQSGRMNGIISASDSEGSEIVFGETSATYKVTISANDDIGNGIV